MHASVLYRWSPLPSVQWGASTVQGFTKLYRNLLLSLTNLGGNLADVLLTVLGWEALSASVNGANTPYHTMSRVCEYHEDEHTPPPLGHNLFLALSGASLARSHKPSRGHKTFRVRLLRCLRSWALLAFCVLGVLEQGGDAVVLLGNLAFGLQKRTKQSAGS